MWIKVFLHFLFALLAYPVWWAWIFFDSIHLSVSCVAFIVMLLISESLITREMVFSRPGRKWIPHVGISVHSLLMPLSLIIWLMPQGMIAGLFAIGLLHFSGKRFKTQKVNPRQV